MAIWGRFRVNDLLEAGEGYEISKERRVILYAIDE